MRPRIVKQYHELELTGKAVCCTGGHAIEVNYSVFENDDILKDGVACENK